MRKLLISIAVLFLFSSGLFSQEVWSTTDSVLTYTYTRDADSVFKAKVVRSQLDSILIYKSDYHYKWDAASLAWANYRIKESTRNRNGQLFSMDWFNWDDQAAIWYHYLNLDMSYDSAGNLISDMLYVRYPPDYEWIGDVYFSYEYDNAGNRTLYQIDVWNNLEADWIPYEKTAYEFDSAGIKVGEVKYNWASSENLWKEWSRKKYEHLVTSDGSIDSAFNYSWNEATGLWVKESMTVYQYDENELLLEEISHSWAIGWKENGWRPDKKTMSEYDAFGHRTLLIRFENIGSFPDVQWEGDFYKTESAYTSDGQLSLYVMYFWDSGNKKWKFTETDEYLFNSYGVKTSHSTFKPGAEGMDSILVEKEFFYPEIQNCTIYDSISAGSTYQWEGQAIEVEGIYREVFVSEFGSDSIRTLNLSVYNPYGVGVEEKGLLGGIVLYPVPVKDYLHITSELGFVEIGVVDMSGRELIRVSGSSADLSQLNSGVYLVQLRNREGVLIGTRKIVKE